jgi:hypothetical protein
VAVSFECGNETSVTIKWAGVELLGSRGNTSFSRRILLHGVSSISHHPEDLDLHKQHCENLTCRNVLACFMSVRYFGPPDSAVSCVKAVLCLRYTEIKL